MDFTPAIILWICIVSLLFSGGGIIPVILTSTLIVISITLKPWSWKAKHCRLTSRSPLPFLIIYLLIMLLPIQVGHWGCSGPVRGQQNQQVVETLDAVMETGINTGAMPVFSITRNRSGTLRFLLLALCTLSGFLIMSMASARQRAIWLQALILVSVPVAAAGIAGRWVFPQGDSLLWIFPVPHGRPGPMGAFMNRNHFAGYFAMLSPATVLLSLHHFHHKNITGTLINSMAALLFSSGVFLSLSRGGMLAWAAGMAVLSLIGIRSFDFKLRKTGVLFVLTVLFAALAISLPNSFVQERIYSIQQGTSDPSFTSRLAAWRGALAIWRHYPLLGAGPNAFRTVYPQHRISTARESRDFAENEYLQWLAETGLIGLILIGWIAFGAGSHLRKEAQLRSSHADVCMAAATCALAVAAMHALVDFPLRLPVYALTLASLGGMLWQPSSGHEEALAQNRAAGLGALGLLIGLMSLALHLQHDQPGRITGADFSKTAKALAAAPTFPAAWRRLANLLWEINTPEARVLSEQTLSIAARYDPNNYPLWKRLGDIRQQLGDETGAMEAYREVRRLRSWVRLPVDLPEEVP